MLVVYERWGTEFRVGMGTQVAHTAERSDDASPDDNGQIESVL